MTLKYCKCTCRCSKKLDLKRVNNLREGFHLPFTATWYKYFHGWRYRIVDTVYFYFVPILYLLLSPTLSGTSGALSGWYWSITGRSLILPGLSRGVPDTMVKVTTTSISRALHQLSEKHIFSIVFRYYSWGSRVRFQWFVWTDKCFILGIGNCNSLVADMGLLFYTSSIRL